MKLITRYRKLADGLSDMVEEGRMSSLKAADYQWIVNRLIGIAGADPAPSPSRQRKRPPA